MRESRPVLLVAVVTYNSSPTIEACLNSLYEHIREADLHVSVVDNSPDEATVATVRAVLACRPEGSYTVERSGVNVGWAAGNNRAISNVRAALGRTPDVVLLVNPDAVLNRDASHVLLQAFADWPDAGVAGGAEVEGAGPAHPAFFPFHTLSDLVLDVFLIRRHRTRRLRARIPRDHVTSVGGAYPSGACLAIPGPVLDRIGPLDERYFLYFDDEDYTRRVIGAGLQVLSVPDLSYTHTGGASSDTLDADVTAARRRVAEIAQVSRRAFYLKWYGAAAYAPLAIYSFVWHKLRSLFGS